MKHLTKKILISIALLLTTPVGAFAAATDNKVTLKLPIPGLKNISDNAYLTFTNIFTLIFTIAVSITVLALIANGIRYIVAFGNEDQIEKAKQGLYYSILGFVILALAYTIAATVNFIFAP